MKLRDIILEITSDELFNTWLEKKLITSDDVDKINQVTNNQNYRKWLGNLVKNNILKSEDIYKFENYLNIHSKYSKKYPIKDISLIKTEKDLSDFKSISIKIMDLNYKSNDNSSPHLNTNEISYLKEVGIEYFGIVEGFQVFKVPMELKDNVESYKIYKTILGRCSGGTIEICTIKNFDDFNYYLETDNLYVLYNHSNPQSPYQIHLKSLSFLDRSDNDSMDKDLKILIMRKLNLFIGFIFNVVRKNKSLKMVDITVKDLTDDEKKRFIDFIVSLDKVNLTLYDIELKDFTNEQRNAFIDKIVTYGLGIIDYNLKLDDLTDEQKEKYINRIIDRAHVLITNEKVKRYDLSINDLTQEQKNKYIDKKINDGHKLLSIGLNLNNLTPEQKKKYIDKNLRFIDDESQLNSYGITINDLTPEQIKLIK